MVTSRSRLSHCLTGLLLVCGLTWRVSIGYSQDRVAAVDPFASEFPWDETSLSTVESAAGFDAQFPGEVEDEALDGSTFVPDESEAAGTYQLTSPELAGLDDPGVLEPPEQMVSLSASHYENIMRRLDALEQKGKEKEKEKAAPKKDDAGGWTDLSTEKWTVKLGGHIQGDYVNWAKADPQITARPGTMDYFEFRRLRLMADGTGYGVYEFRLQIDIEPEAESEDNVTGPFTAVKDAYLSILEMDYFGKLRFGNFFVPYSLEQVTNDTNNIFLERSIPTQGVFAADREVGVASYNWSEDKNFSWTYGCFFDSISEAIKERVDDNQGYRLSGRVVWLPYYDEPSNGRYLIHTGAGILFTDDRDNRVRFRTRPQIHEGPFLIDSGILDATSYTSANVELATVMGPVSVQSELFLTNVNMSQQDSVNLTGAYVYASYFLTGENRIYERVGQHGPQFGRNVPYTNFFCIDGCHGTGAWEAKARMSYLNLNEVESGTYHDLTLGFNWYWSDRMRMMFDYIHPITSADTTYGATNSDILATRLDVNW